MRTNWLSGIACVALLGACASENEAAPAEEKAVSVEFGDADAHRTAGLAVAEADYPGLASLCGDPSPILNLERVTSGPSPRPMPDEVPEARVFDNLLFVGNRFSSAWVVETSEGLILIDALLRGEEVERDIEAGLVSLGLDPANLKYVVISHGHGDHTGGASYLGSKYDVDVVMSRVDWEISQDPERGIQLPGWNDVPEPAVLVEGEYELALGDTVLKLVETPGHTMGTMSSVIDVTNGEDNHTAVIWGGTGFNFGPMLDQYQAYANSAEAMRQRVLDEGIDVFLSNHVARDGTDNRIAAMEGADAGAPHPFVAGPEHVARAFEVFRECSLFQGSTLLQSENKG